VLPTAVNTKSEMDAEVRLNVSAEAAAIELSDDQPAAEK
jgi:hypothetical protein